jgi:large subunit ribosomal protein L5
MSTVPGDDRLVEETGAAESAPAKAPRKKRTTASAKAPSAKKLAAETSTADETPTAEAPVAEAPVAKAPAAKASTAKPKRAPKAAPKGTVETAAPVEESPVPTPSRPEPKPRLELYRSEIVPTMMHEQGYRNVMEVPRLGKVVVNIGLGEALTNPKAIESASKDISTITGQRVVVTRARNSIAGFKLREGNQIGVSVTLRGRRMYQFVDRLLNAALPRIRDFRGVSLKSFDGRGNYSLGIREQIIFPEIDYGQIERIRGLQVSIVTTARTDTEAARLLTLFGMPFARQN